MSVSVTVLCFAQLRERLGAESCTVTVPAGTTVAQVYATVFPGAPDTRVPVMYALDAEYVSPSTPVRDGAELALIPPLGGG